MKNIKILLVLFTSIVILFSCDDFDSELDQQFSEDPTPLEVVSEATAEQIFRGFFQTVNSYDGPGLALTTMADMNTCSWGNQGMRDTSSEPRVAWNNASNYGNEAATSVYFNGLYSLLADSNNLVFSVENGLIEYDNPERTLCMARFGQAVSLGYLALVFDQIWISDENGLLNNAESTTPSATIDLALNQIDKAIELASNNSFDLDGGFINGQTYSSSQFSEYLNSIAARLLINSVRNSAQRDALDWNRALNYANNGLTYDFMVTGDGYNTWFNEWIIYSVFPGWARIDMRVINLMDSNTIDYWTSSDGFLGISTSDDSRLVSDFEHLSSQDFIPSRGLYHYSNYRHSRYDAELHGSGWEGATPEFLKAENDLYKAEALLRTNQLSQAADVINTGTRVTRGNLTTINADAIEIANAIHYERSVELLTTGMGIGFFEMRRENLLQAGTLLHFPVPGKALESANIGNYTFGGTSGIAGEDYSTGGWR